MKRLLDYEAPGVARGNVLDLGRFLRLVLGVAVLLAAAAAAFTVWNAVRARLPGRLGGFFHPLNGRAAQPQVPGLRVF